MADGDPRPPRESVPLSESPAISEAAEQARERLHREIERVRAGVEEMMAEQAGGDDRALRRELESIRQETRAYVKRRVRKSEKRLEKRIDRLEERLDAAERDRQYAEWRIHTNTEAMLDGLLHDVRAIADVFAQSR